MEKFQEWLDNVTGPATEALGSFNDAFYTWVIIGLLVATGIALTILTRGVQFRHLPTMVHHLRHSRQGSEGGISSFQAFAMGMATRIGIGNITGVALAMILGGPGALFWMWLVAIFGMATAFAEATLAQIFKYRHHDGTFRGGPATYILKGTGYRPLAVVFAVCMLFCMAIAMPMVQANTIAGVMSASHGIDSWVTAVVVAVLTLAVIVFGVRGIARATEWISPIMALAYLVTAVAVIALNISAVPQFFVDVFNSAFGLDEAVAGTAGGIMAALLNGVRRGLFSNEAGMGTNPNAAATATVAHPAQQGFIQSFGVFLDTMLVCSATGFIIMTSGVIDLHGLDQDASAYITSDAITTTLGPWMAIPLSIMIFFFGFSSILGAYTYAEGNLDFLGKNTPLYAGLMQFSFVVTSAIGALLALPFVWNLLDTAMGVVTILNLIGVLALARWVAAALKDYEAGPEEKFNPSSPHLPRELQTDSW